MVDHVTRQDHVLVLHTRDVGIVDGVTPEGVEEEEIRYQPRICSWSGNRCKMLLQWKGSSSFPEPLIR